MSYRNQHEESPTALEPSKVSIDTRESQLVRHLVPETIQDTVARIVEDTRGDYDVEREVWYSGKKMNQSCDVQFRSDVSKGCFHSGTVTESKPLSQDMNTAISWANLENNSNFNSILITKYSNGTKNADELSIDKFGIDPNGGILVISHGAERKFGVREKGTRQPIKEIPMRQGEAIQMIGKFQHHFTHEIPCEPGLLTECVLLTFRTHDCAEEKKLWNQQMQQVKKKDIASQAQKERKAMVLEQLAQIKAERAERERAEAANRERVKRNRERTENEQEAVRNLAMRLV